MKIGFIGYGKMGRAVEELAHERGHIPFIGRKEPVDCVIDFSSSTSVVGTAKQLSRKGIPWVLGTTGSNQEEVLSLAKKGEIALPLYPLHRAFGLKAVAVTYLQALSGGGRECHLDKNILPYIEGEEEKTEREIKKIFETSDLKFSVHSTRVPIPHGHLAMVSASFKTKPSLDEVKKHWEAFAPLIYREEMDHPQPALYLISAFQPFPIILSEGQQAEDY